MKYVSNLGSLDSAKGIRHLLQKTKLVDQFMLQLRLGGCQICQIFLKKPAFLGSYLRQQWRRQKILACLHRLSAYVTGRRHPNSIPCTLLKGLSPNDGPDSSTPCINIMFCKGLLRCLGKAWGEIMLHKTPIGITALLSLNSDDPKALKSYELPS